MCFVYDQVQRRELAYALGAGCAALGDFSLDDVQQFANCLDIVAVAAYLAPRPQSRCRVRVADQHALTMRGPHRRHVVNQCRFSASGVADDQPMRGICQCLDQIVVGGRRLGRIGQR